MAHRWYVIHVYSGFEKKVAQSIREQATRQYQQRWLGNLLLLGLLREVLKTLSEALPLLCFDEVDLLRPDEVEAHTQIVAFLGSLRDPQGCACLFIGQRPVIEVDEHYSLEGLDEAAVQHYLSNLSYFREIGKG